LPKPALPSPTKGLQDPQILAMLSKLLAPGSNGGKTDAASLLPAIQTLAKVFKEQDPELANVVASTSTVQKPAGSTVVPQSDPAPRQLMGRMSETFPPIDKKAKGNLNPYDAAGCFNCKRRKSQTWRQGRGRDGVLVTVCNG